MTRRAFAAMAAKQILQHYEYEPQPLGQHDVEVAITHCGICHSDIHLIDNDWQSSIYPLVPGHEIVGTVARKGDLVGHLDIGQRVGIGWQCGSCHTCEYCTRGEENLCPTKTATCVGRHGGFANLITVDSRFAFAVPEKLSSENAAPLLCGGITVYSPLRLYDVKPWMRVGVVGIGGLGHMAVQFARAFGCHVTAFSSSSNKEAEARKFGAHEFVNSADPKALKAAQKSLDFIIVTVFVDLDWVAYLNALRPNGKLCFVGAILNPITVPVMPILVGQKSICGSATGGRPAIMEMLDFAAQHNIMAQTELMPMERCNEAVAKVRENKARYRIVLIN